MNFLFVVRFPLVFFNVDSRKKTEKNAPNILDNPSCESNNFTGCRNLGDFEVSGIFKRFFLCFNVNLTHSVFFVFVLKVSKFQLVGVFNWFKFQCVQFFSPWIFGAIWKSVQPWTSELQSACDFASETDKALSPVSLAKQDCIYPP